MTMISNSSCSMPLSSTINPLCTLGVGGNVALHYLGKSPMEFVGERVLRPAIDKISKVFHSLSSWTLLPVASAQEIHTTKANPLFFPDKEVIISRFKHHPLTSALYLKEKRFYETIATFFAQSKIPKIPATLLLDVQGKWEYLNRPYSHKEFNSLVGHCTSVLEECAGLNQD